MSSRADLGLGQSLRTRKSKFSWLAVLTAQGGTQGGCLKSRLDLHLQEMHVEGAGG